MRTLILCISATYILSSCYEEKNSAATPTPAPSAKPAATAAAAPAAAPATATPKNTNLLKAPIDRTRSVLDQVKKGNAGNEL